MSVILAVKAMFYTTASSSEVSQNNCDTDGPLEIAIRPPNLEIHTSVSEYVTHRNSNGNYIKFSTTVSTLNCMHVCTSKFKLH